MCGTDMASDRIRGTRHEVPCWLGAADVSIERLEAARMSAAGLMLEGEQLGSNEEDGQI
jgi:hypothetical protein